MGIALANGGYRFIERTLCAPATGHFLMNVVVDSTLRRYPRLPMIHNIGGGSLEEITERAARRLVDVDIIESLNHIFHPRIPLLLPDFETLMRFVQAQPPPELRVLRWTSQKLHQKRGEFFDRAPKSLAGKERPQHLIPFYASIECGREFATRLRAAYGLKYVRAVQIYSRPFPPVSTMIATEGDMQSTKSERMRSYNLLDKRIASDVLSHWAFTL
jgi:hypothetical protein